MCLNIIIKIRKILKRIPFRVALKSLEICIPEEEILYRVSHGEEYLVKIMKILVTTTALLT